MRPARSLRTTAERGEPCIRGTRRPLLRRVRRPRRVRMVVVLALA